MRAKLASKMAYGHGKLKASRILQGSSYTYGLNQVKGLSTLSTAQGEHGPRFLGKVSDYLFFHNPANKSTLIMRFENETSLELKDFAEKPPAPRPAGGRPFHSGPAGIDLPVKPTSAPLVKH